MTISVHMFNKITPHMLSTRGENVNFRLLSLYSTYLNAEDPEQEGKKQ